MTYKCEATNLVGKSESLIDLLNHHQNKLVHNHLNKHMQVFNSAEASDYNDDHDDYSDRFNGRTFNLNSHSNKSNNFKYQYHTNNKSNKVNESGEKSSSNEHFLRLIIFYSKMFKFIFFSSLEWS